MPKRCKAWRERYDAAVKRGKLAGFGEEFHRLWRYYLMYCEGGFRGRRDRRRAGDAGEGLGVTRLSLPWRVPADEQ